MDSAKLLPFVKDGTLTWTMTTNGYKYYTLNLLRWLQEVAKVPWKLCIICCDAESFTFFQREGIPCVGYRIGEFRGQAVLAAFGSTEFRQWNRIKIDILKWMCENAGGLGLDVSLYLDGDIVIQKDPWPVLKGIAGPGADLVFQCDCANAEEHSNCGVICTGVIRIQHINAKQADLFAFDKELWDTCEGQDQPYVARRLLALGLEYRTLDRRQFGNGHWQKGLAWKDGNWTLLHYNYRVGNTKKAAMKTYGHWRIPY